jgi:hypothetical protein
MVSTLVLCVMSHWRVTVWIWIRGVFGGSTFILSVSVTNHIYLSCGVQVASAARWASMRIVTELRDLTELKNSPKPWHQNRPRPGRATGAARRIEAWEPNNHRLGWIRAEKWALRAKYRSESLHAADSRSRNNRPGWALRHRTRKEKDEIGPESLPAGELDQGLDRDPVARFRKQWTKWELEPENGEKSSRKPKAAGH